MNQITPVAQARDAIIQALHVGVSPGGLPAALLLERGTLKLYFYEPRGQDLQEPHDQDEIYIVISGSGTIAIDSGAGGMNRMKFAPGDSIFVPAGAEHRFEDFTDDFGTWVIMYGRDGGEVPGESPAVPRH